MSLKGVLQKGDTKITSYTSNGGPGIPRRLRRWLAPFKSGGSGTDNAVERDVEKAMGSRQQQRRRSGQGSLWAAVGITCLLTLVVQVSDGRAQEGLREQIIPILGVMYDQEPVGTVTHLILSMDVREDDRGLAVHFKNRPGRFSHMAQTAIEQAIYRSARALGQSPDSWTVVLSLPYQGVTIYGNSLSAMVALSVVALANGEFVPPGRVITGTVSPDGHIGTVSGVPLKIAAASKAHIHRILVPEEQDVTDPDWKTPFLVQISPVRSVRQAYEALTAMQQVQ